MSISGGLEKVMEKEEYRLHKFKCPECGHEFLLITKEDLENDYDDLCPQCYIEKFNRRLIFEKYSAVRVR